MIEDKHFVHLHNHIDSGSNVRMRDSSLTCEELITIPSSWGQNSVSITDHEALCSHMEAINKLNELKNKNKINKDFKLILGNEIYLNNRIDTERDLKDKNKKCLFNHFILLAKDNKGYEQIRKLSSIAWKDNYFVYKGMKRVPTYYDNIEEIIQQDKGHLIALSACIGSRLGELFKQTLEEGKTEEDIEDLKDVMAEHIEWCIDMFGQDDFYIEMQPNLFEEQIKYNKMLVNIAQAYELQMVITTDTHYALEKDFKLHEAFLKSKEGDEERNVVDFYKDSHFFYTKDIYKNMDYLDKEIIDEAILNTERIAKKCNVGEKNDYELFRSSKIPLTPLPDKETWYKLDMNIINKYEFMKKMYNDKYVYHTYLLSLIFKGLSYRKLNSTLEHYYERINEELQEIYLLSVAMNEPIGAYLTTEKMNLDVMWEVSLISVGRGSSVVDVINYLLEITDVDPLLIRKLGLEMPIWRFIQRDKWELPDIDTDNCSHLKNEVFAKTKEYYNSFGSDVIRIVTFKKEKPKSSIKTACKGLGINNDVASLLSSLIPIERGVAWSIKDCYYGNEEEHRKPISEFIKLIDEYEEVNLLQTTLKINGLVTAIGTHASGVLMINNPITNYSGVMRSPSGELCCSYDLHQIEQCGCVKYDFLLTSAMSLLQICMIKLCEDGFMEWQGNLKKTYQKYLSPSVINLEDKEVWENIKQGKVMNLFQFDSNQGRETMNKLKPSNLIELANANALMRLKAEEKGAEQPIDKYIRFKNNPTLWEDEMDKHGLSEKDKKVCHKLLDDQYGVCSNQESMMKMFMDRDTGNFSVKECNILKSGVAKKNEKKLKQFEDLIKEKLKNDKNLSLPLMNYLFYVQTSYQKNYAFSIPHTIAYSLVGYQEAWLYTKYPKIYWYFANLSVQTNTIDQNEEDYEFDFKVTKKTMDYGKIAVSIDSLMHQGVNITTPDINNSDESFKPIAKENTILYGLEGINSVNEEMVELIKINRPYTSFMDFYNRIGIQKKEVVSEETKKSIRRTIISNKAIEMLIKSGCFDKIEKNKTREQILFQFCSILAKTKNKLTVTDITFMEDNNMIPLELKDEVRIYNFSSFLKKEMPTYPHETSKNMRWIKIKEENSEDTEYDKEFFYTFFAEYMEEGKDYFLDDEGIINVLIGTKRKGSFEGILIDKLKKLTDYMNTKEAINQVNTIKLNEFKKPLFEGGINKWEMQSISFYNKEHELVNANCDKYDIVNYFNLPEEAEIEKMGHFTIRKGKEVGKEVTYPIWKLNLIAGTILSKNNTKHIVTLLTKEGVVNIKFQEGQYAFYNKKISKDVWNEKKCINEKKTVENSWFTRGNILLIIGYRRGSTFVAKRYANTKYQHTIQLITNIKNNGDLVMKQDRVKI
jgi:DNA polymerase-3 subunit alpha